MYLQKVIGRTNFKKRFFAGILKVNDENSRIQAGTQEGMDRIL